LFSISVRSDIDPLVAFDGQLQVLSRLVGIGHPRPLRRALFYFQCREACRSSEIGGSSWFCGGLVFGIRGSRRGGRHTSRPSWRNTKTSIPFLTWKADLTRFLVHSA
jgi:hypothetical protein